MSNPTTLAGFMDDSALSVDGFGEVVDLLLENIPALQHPESVRTYAAMRHETQLGAIIRTYLLGLERGRWTVNGEGCRDEVTARIAADFGLPIKGYTEPDADDPGHVGSPLDVAMRPSGARRRKFSWAKHLPTAVKLSLSYGHAPFAQQWMLGDDGKFQLYMVQERMPQTITGLKFNTDGTLKAAVQSPLIGAKSVPVLTTGNAQLVWYAREREGSNYYGESLLRDAYSPWLIKEQVMRIWPTSHRRNGIGVWQITAPPGATGEQVAQAQRIASTTRASENAGIGLPAGFTAELKGMTGSLPNHAELVTYLDRLMTRNTLTSILDMATAERGNRSLGETVMQLMVYAQEAEAARIALDATEQMVIPLVNANFGEDEPAPCIDVEDVGIDDQLTAQDLNWLFEYGGINPDDKLEEDIRKRKHLPPIDHATRRIEITEAPPEPVAPVDPTGGDDA